MKDTYSKLCSVLSKDGTLIRLKREGEKYTDALSWLASYKSLSLAQVVLD